MHHYGEAAVKVDLSKTTFNIVLLNHITGAEITISGPRKGVYDTKERELDQTDALKIGHEIAHLIRTLLV
jgi:hypothetical protein